MGIPLIHLTRKRMGMIPCLSFFYPVRYATRMCPSSEHLAQMAA